MKKYLFIAISVFVLAAAASCAPDPSIDLDRSSVSATSDGCSESVNVTTTYDWTASSSESWVKVSPSSGVKGTSQVTIRVDASNVYDPRTATVTFSSEGITKTISVQQAQKSSVVVTTGDFNLRWTADTIKVKVRANVDYSYSVPAGVGWIKELTTKAFTDREHTFLIEENTDAETRSAVITFKDNASGASDDIKITQEGNVIFSIAEGEVRIPYTENIFAVRVSANSQYTYELPDANWLSAAEAPDTKAVVDEDVYFAAARSFVHKTRSAVISFFNARKERFRVWVYQDAAPYFLEFRVTGSEVAVPSLRGRSEDAMVDWGDGSNPEPYSEELVHLYTDGAKKHIIKVSSQEATSVKFNNIVGVDEVDFTQF